MHAPLQVAIIEDSIEDRFFLRRALKEVRPDCEVVEFSFVEESLAFLRSPDRAQLDLIFVDINTPRMTGFDFIDAYETLYPELKKLTKVYVISSSINPDDSTRAETHPVVAGFLRKPITAEDLAAILS